MAYNYYMTPVERERYEQQKLFNTIAAIGKEDPYYALGLALGQGLGNSYGNNAIARQENKLDAFVNSELSPSTQVQLQDEALKEMLQPDAQKELVSLANAQPGTVNPIGETKYIQTPEQQGFTAPSITDISEYARTHGINNNVLNGRMASYQQQIKDRAREYYVPRIGELVENGALTSNNGLAQLANEIGQYGQYDQTAAKNITATLGGLMKPATTNRAARSGGLLTGTMGGTSQKAAQSTGYSPKLSDINTYITQRQNVIDSAFTSEEDKAVAKNELARATALQNKLMYGEETTQHGDNDTDDEGYEAEARKLGVLAENIKNLGRAEEKPKQPTTSKQGDGTISLDDSSPEAFKASLQSVMTSDGKRRYTDEQIDAYIKRKFNL